MTATRTVIHATALGIVGAEIDPAQSCEGDGLGTHGTGFQGDVEIGLGQALGDTGRGGRAQHQQLRMGGGIVQLLDPVARRGEDASAAAIDQHGAHRHLAARAAALGLGQRLGHRIAGGIDDFR